MRPDPAPPSVLGRYTLGVAICTYDRAATLAGLLKSIAGNSARPDRLLVINNGPDKLSEAVAASAPEGVRVEYLRLATPGLSVARNAALDALDHDYILFLDDDVRLPSGYFAALREAIDEHAPDMLGGPIQAIFESQPPLWLPEEFVSRRKRPNSGWLTEEGVSGGNFAVRRDVFSRIGGFDANLGMQGRRLGFLEEYEFTLRYRIATERPAIFYCAECVVGHLTPPDKHGFTYLARRHAKAHWQKGRLFAALAASRRGLRIAALAQLGAELRWQKSTRPLSRWLVRWLFALLGRAAFLAGTLAPARTCLPAPDGRAGDAYAADNPWGYATVDAPEASVSRLMRLVLRCPRPRYVLRREGASAPKRFWISALGLADFE